MQTRGSWQHPPHPRAALSSQGDQKVAGRGEERLHEGFFRLQRAPLALLTLSSYCQGTFETPLKRLQHVGHCDWAGGEIHIPFEVWILEQS